MVVYVSQVLPSVSVDDSGFVLGVVVEKDLIGFGLILRVVYYCSTCHWLRAFVKLPFKRV
jgi:hypothetical protein